MSGAEKIFYLAAFQTEFQILRIYAVVLYGISRAYYPDVFKAGNGAVKSFLHILRQTGRHALYIHFVCIQTLRLNKELMSLFIGKSVYLIFDGRAVSWAYALDLSAEQSRTVEIGPYYIVSLFVGICEPAGNFVFSYIVI